LVVVMSVSVALAAFNMLVAFWLNYDGYRQIIAAVSVFWIGMGVIAWLVKEN
jgi:hypothetical protein